MSLILGSNANFGQDDLFDTGRIEQVILSARARKQGTYVIGTTGTGKTTLLLNLILQDMSRPGPKGYEGLCVLDPHGDFISDILSCVPRNRLNDVEFFDPTDIEYPSGLNLLDCNRDSPKERDYVTSAIIDVLYKLFDYSWGPRMEDLLRHSILSLLLHTQPTTMIDLMLVLASREHRQRLTAEAKKKDPVLRAYWEEQFPESYQDKKHGNWHKPKEQTELVGSALNKIGRFIVNPVLRHIIGQEHSAFDLRRVMDEGKILLVNLSKGDLGPDNAALLGAVIVNQILIAALSRRDTPEADRRPFHLYVDEYQTFATKTFPELQSEARKYAIDTVVAHQYRDQLDRNNLGASLNVANIICLRVSGKDGVELALQYDLEPPPSEMRYEPVRYQVGDGLFTQEYSVGTGSKLEQLVEGHRQLYSDVQLETANLLAQLPNYQAIGRVLMGRGLVQFRIDLADKPAVDEKRGDKAQAYIRNRMRQRARYTRVEIEQWIRTHMQSDYELVDSLSPYDVQ